jgi:hypothetical protein
MTGSVSVTFATTYYVATPLSMYAAITANVVECRIAMYVMAEIWRVFGIKEELRNNMKVFNI